jgi:hypothetical protein
LIKISSLGYWYLTCLGGKNCLKIAIKKVSRLTLPRNISTIRTILLSSLRDGVRFKDNPTVPKAEKHSKVVFRTSTLGSKTESKKTEDPTAKSDNKIITVALCTAVTDISLCLNSILSLPRMMALRLRKVTAKVVVLIPPPVEPGEAPTHIKKIIIRTVEGSNVPMSTLLNPAVLVGYRVEKGYSKFAKPAFVGR